VAVRLVGAPPMTADQLIGHVVQVIANHLRLEDQPPTHHCRHA
jgi:hypothetical protein